MDYNFKVVAKLRDDLTDEEHKMAFERLTKWQRKYKMINIDEITYRKAGPIQNYDDFGAVAFFYCVLKDFKECFEKLEYYDFGEGIKRVAI